MVVLKCFYKLIDNLLGIFQRITLLKVSKISTILKYPFTLRVIKRQIASVQYKTFTEQNSFIAVTNLSFTQLEIDLFTEKSTQLKINVRN